MKYFLYALGATIIVLFVFFGAGRLGTSKNDSGAHGVALRPNQDLGLVTEPADGIVPVLRMIADASSSVDLVMYELDDAQVERALVAAKADGIAVRVILSSGYYGEASTVNGQAYDFLQSAGVAVRWSPAYFALTHEKALVTDQDAAMIMTFNLTPEFYATSRDFGIVDEDRDDVNAIESVFDADWKGSEISASPADDLMWSPGSESATIALIASATGTLDVYNEEMADGNIMDALVSAARRGVAVRVDMTYSSKWKTAFQRLAAAGAQVRTYAASAPLYIHAKMILVDDRETFVGSQNFSATSQNDNRELGIFVTDPMILKSLSGTFDGDWKDAKPW